jgi:hypothetical protein
MEKRYNIKKEHILHKIAIQSKKDRIIKLKNI